ncbi:MFS transporter [Amycolatopsis sp. A1MSW2902]|uniref:MFS transporter n=1 Tax=Amycolatopsis sp. A1MSW2902 TaxID=687413 RepID=UPI00307FBD69
MRKPERGTGEPTADGGQRVLAPPLLATVVIVQFLAALDLSLMNLAVPEIRGAFGLDESAAGWVIAAYTLVFGGFLLVGGRLGDLWGRRRVLVAGLAVFGLASLLGGLAGNGAVLIAARALQGLGAAAAVPISLALVTAETPEGPMRRKALGAWATGAIAGSAVGVVLGGLLTASLGWRSVFLVNLPIVAAALFCAIRLPGRARDGAARLDLAGAVLATAGTGLLVLAVGEAPDAGWDSPLVVGGLVAAVVLLTGFVLVERRVEAPLLRLGLFARREVLAANIFGFLITAGQLAAFFFVSLQVQIVLGYSPLWTGIAFLPFCLGSVAGMRFTAHVLLARYGARTILVVGGTVGTLGIAWYGLGGPGGGFFADVLGPSLVTSIGIGASFVAMGSAATSGVPPEEAGMVSGMLSSFRMVGGAIGLAVLSTVAVSASHGPDPIAAASAGHSAALFVAAVAVLAGSLFCLVIPRRAKTADTEETAVGSAADDE